MVVNMTGPYCVGISIKINITNSVIAEDLCILIC